jgi:hypothetical protein
MKNVFLSALLATTLVAVGQEPQPKPERKGPPPLTAEQKQARKEIIAKYDTNKDGVLSIDEREKLTPEDRKKLRGPRGPGGPERPEGPRGPRGPKPDKAK